MAREYIEKRNGGYYFIGSRVSLDSAIYEFLRGEPPEAIVHSFPSLSLEQVYGGITFYLANRADIDSYLGQREVQFTELARAAREANPLLYAKLQAARRSIPALS